MGESVCVCVCEWVCINEDSLNMELMVHGNNCYLSDDCTGNKRTITKRRFPFINAILLDIFAISLKLSTSYQ